MPSEILDGFDIRTFFELICDVGMPQNMWSHRKINGADNIVVWDFLSLFNFDCTCNLFSIHIFFVVTLLGTSNYDSLP